MNGKRTETEQTENRKNRNYEPELPEGYGEALVVDATTKKFSIRMNLAALAAMLVIAVPAFFIIQPLKERPEANLLPVVVFMAALLAYVVLHELVHGAAYKLMTGHKLTFGFTATVAYCGVPDIYVYRKTALIALLAPFIVFSVVFALTAALVPTPVEKFLGVVLFALHFGGCVGDLYDTALFLTKLRDPGTLMRDTGPVQTFYLPAKD